MVLFVIHIKRSYETVELDE